MRAKWLQSCPTLCDPMDCSLSGPSVHRIFQARILTRDGLWVEKTGWRADSSK